MTTHGSSNRWRAHWIWDRRDLTDEERLVIAARREFELSSVPDSAPGRVFADSRYVLFVNGTEVRRGPGRANPRSRRYDVVDVAPLLVPGTNVVTILAAVDQRASRNWMPAPTAISELGGGALVCEIDVGLPDPVATDGSWLTTAIPGWTLSEPTGVVSQRGLEVIDLGRIPEDLHAPGVAAGGVWRPASVKSGQGMGDRESIHPPSYPFGPTRPSTLPAPDVVDRPLTQRPDGLWLLDDVGSGTLVLDVEGPPGAVVEIDTAEIIEADGTPRPFHEPIGLRLVLGEGRRSVESLDLFGLRAVAVQAPPGTTVHAVVLRERTHPVAGDARFACSDPFLDGLYTAGRRTVTLCSLDAYVDNPTREGRAWTGDSVVHGMVDLVTNADWSLARWNPRMGLLSAMPDGMIPAAVGGDGEHTQAGIVSDWGLHWVRAVRNLHRYAGDVDETAELLTGVERVVRWFDQFHNPVTGLPTDVLGWVLVDWAWVPTRGASSVLAGLLGRALLDLAEMSDAVGDPGRAGRARDRHAELSRAFEAFWDDERGRYTDNLVEGVRQPTASQHGQAAAIVGGFAPQHRHERLVSLLTDTTRHVHATLSHPEGDPGMDGATVLPGAEMLLPRLPEPWWDTERLIVMAQPFFRYVVHDALTAAGRNDLVAGMLRAWEPLVARCSTSFGETFWGGSIAQGWSSTPTRDLVTKVLGVTPAEPGYAVADVSPALGGLDWAEGVVPTPRGPLSVRVDRREVVVDSPVPVVVEGRRRPAGRHVLAREGDR